MARVLVLRFDWMRVDAWRYLCLGITELVIAMFYWRSSAYIRRMQMATARQRWISFENALRNMGFWYAHNKTCVFLLTKQFEPMLSMMSVVGHCSIAAWLN